MTLRVSAPPFENRAFFYLAFLFLTISLAADAIAYRQVNLFNIFFIPGPPVIYPITYAIADVITEVYGYNRARFVIWTTLSCEFLFAMMILFVVNLKTPATWHNDHSFHLVFDGILRFICAGFLAVLASNFLNVMFVSYFKVKCNGRLFKTRSIASSAIGQLLMVIVIVSVGYYGHDKDVMRLKDLMHFGCSIFFVEMCWTCFLAIPAQIVSSHIKSFEKIDVYDRDLKYKIFSLK